MYKGWLRPSLTRMPIVRRGGAICANSANKSEEDILEKRCPLTKDRKNYKLARSSLLSHIGTLHVKNAFSCETVPLSITVYNIIYVLFCTKYRKYFN